MYPNKKEIESCYHGISSYYYQVNSKIGIKFFKSKRERDASKYYQHIASLSYLAPKVGKNVYSDGYFGYEVEHVEMLHHKYKTWKSIPNRLKNQVNQLINDLLDSCDFEADTNWHNFGIKNNNLCYVDFGFCDNYSYVAR